MNVNAKTKAIHHDQPLNLETANHIIALSLSIVLHFANQPTPPSSEHLNAAVKRCAVLGAGGCIFPIILSSILPRTAQIHAIELSEFVIHAALNFFSVSPYVSNLMDFQKCINADTATALLTPSNVVDNQFQLHAGCGVQWLTQEVASEKKEKLDMIFIDIFDGDVDKADVEASEHQARITDELIVNATLDTSLDIDVGITPSDDGGSTMDHHNDAPFAPENSELFIPSKNILNRENIRVFTEALSDNGGVLAINTVGNLEAIEGAVRWIDDLLNSHSAPTHSLEEQEENRTGTRVTADAATPPPRYHVGFMKVPIVLEESADGEEGSRGARGNAFVRRDNIVLFIVKNPTIPIMTSDIFHDNFRKYVAMSDEQSRPQSTIPLPFSNKKLEPFLLKWISMYENVSDAVNK